MFTHAWHKVQSHYSKLVGVNPYGISCVSFASMFLQKAGKAGNDVQVARF